MLLVYERFPVARILYYRIGGIARFLLEASSRADVFAALDVIWIHDLAPVVVGPGTNLLFPDEPFDGVVLRIFPGSSGQIRALDDRLIEAFSGERLGEVLTFSLAHGRTGLEWAGVLPGTVGAAVRGNVGAYGGELRDVLE